MKRMAVLSGVLLLIFFISGMSFLQAEEMADWQRASLEFYEGNFAETAEILREYEDEDIVSEDDHKALEYLVKAEINLSHLNRAEDLLLRLEEFNYVQPELHWLLGREYLSDADENEEDSLSKAIEHLEAARDSGFFGIPQKRKLGHAYIGVEKFSQALELLEDVRAADPRTEDFSALARAYSETDQPGEAVNAYERLIVLSPHDFEAYLTLGSLYRELDNPREAVEVYEQGLDYNPDNIELQKALVDVYYELEEYEEAEGILQDIIADKPDMYEVHYDLGRVYQKQGEWEDAEESYEIVLEYNSEHLRAHLALGELYLERNNHYRALSKFSDTVDRDPDFAPGYYHLARTYYELEMYDSALSEVSTALRKNPGLTEARELREDIFDRILEENQD